MSEPGLSSRVIDYPSSDGKPMTESEAQFLPLTYVALALREHFKQRDDVYVGANMFLYYEQNNPRAVVAPDVFVVVGAPKRVRDSYLLWNEPKGPDFVLEVTSRSTRREDQGRKKRVYASLGVGEYFLFDPTGDYLRPRLQGFVLRQGRYERLPTARLPHGEPSLSSEAVGLDLRVRGEELRLYDPDEGYDLYSYSEWAKAHAREKDRAATEETTRKAAEDRAATEETARKAAEDRAATEETARKAAQARIAELEALLRNLRGCPGVKRLSGSIDEPNGPTTARSTSCRVGAADRIS